MCFTREKVEKMIAHEFNWDSYDRNMEAYYKNYEHTIKLSLDPDYREKHFAAMDKHFENSKLIDKINEDIAKNWLKKNPS